MEWDITAPAEQESVEDSLSAWTYFPEEQEGARKGLVEKDASNIAFFGSAMGGYDSPKGVQAKYAQMKQELMTAGSSQDVHDIEKLLATDTDARRRDKLNLELSKPETTVDEADFLLSQYLLQRGESVSLADEYVRSVANKRKVSTKTQEINKNLDLEFLDVYTDTQKVIDQDVNRSVAQFNKSTVAAMGGFMEVMIPFIEGYIINQAREAAIGEQGLGESLYHLVFAGEAKVDFREAMAKMPPPQRVAAAKRAIKAIEELPFFVADFVKLYPMLDLLGADDPHVAFRVIDDFVGVLDTLLIGGAVRPVLKTIKGAVHSSSPVAKTAIADPEAAGKMAADAIAEPSGEAAKVVGATKDELVTEYVMPKAAGEAFTDLPTNVADELEQMDQVINQVLKDTDTHGINYYEQEKTALKNRIDDALQDVTTLSVKSTRNFIDDGERYAGEVIYGKKKTGFGYAEDALDMAKEAFPEDILKLGEVVLYKKNPKTKELVATTLKEAGDKRGSYFLGYKFNKPYDKTNVSIYGSDAVSKGLFGVFKTGYLQDIVARFDRTVSQAFLSAADKGSNYEKHLLDIVRKDLGKLGSKSRIKLFNVLEAGAKEEKIWSPTDLKLKGLNDKEVSAYYKYRKVNDVLWRMTNSIERSRITEAGNMHIGRIGGDASFYGKAVDQSTWDGIKTAIDPTTGVIVPVDARLISRLEKEGGEIYKLDKAAKIGTDKTTYAIVDGIDTVASAVPDHVLPYIKGYYQRTYKEYYFLDFVPSKLTVDGVAVTDKKTLARHGDTVAGFGTRKAALKAMEMANKDVLEGGGTYAIRSAKEMEFGKAMTTDYDVYSAGLRTTKHRGERLHGAVDGGQARIEDPVESLFRTTRTVSNRYAMEDALASTKQRWMNTWGDKLDVDVFPNDWSLVTRGRATAEEFTDAKAIFELVQNMERIPTKLSQAWKNTIFNVSEALEPYSAPFTKLLRDQGLDFNPIMTARQLSSIAYISLRPLRQLPIQAGQLMQFSFLEPKYLATSFSRELAGLSIARATYKSKDAGREAWGLAYGAKMAGMAEDEFKVLVDTYITKSGLPFSVDSHAFVEGLVKDIHKDHVGSKVGRTYDAVTAPVKKGVEVSRMVGFDAGEFLNLTGSWLMARKRWMDQNPKLAGKWMEKQYADQIAATARELSYAMTLPGTFKYQKGILSLPLQFLAVPHKAMLSVLPASWGGSKVLSGADKARVLAANMTLFGGYAVGLNAAFEKLQEEAGFEIDPQLLLALKGGMVDLGMNSFIQAVMGDEKQPEIQFSKSFAPFAEQMGIPFFDVFSNLAKGDVFKVALGPSYNLLHFKEGRFARAVLDMQHLYNAPDLSTTEKIQDSLLAASSIASGADDYLKARYAIKMGQIISGKGNANLRATSSTALAKLFGFGTYSEDEVYKLLTRFKDDKKAIQESAKRAHESIRRLNLKYENRTEYLPQLLGHQALIAGLDPAEQAIYREEFIKLDRRSLQDIGDSVINSMVQYAAAGAEVREEILAAINGTVSINEEQKEKLRALLDHGLGEKVFTGAE